MVPICAPPKDRNVDQLFIHLPTGRGKYIFFFFFAISQNLRNVVPFLFIGILSERGAPTDRVNNLKRKSTHRDVLTRNTMPRGSSSYTQCMIVTLEETSQLLSGLLTWKRVTPPA